jgi:hypothetical protein
MAQFKKLLSILPPPESPLESTGEWKDVAKEIGTPFPEDYKKFIAAYGTGSICNEFQIMNPFSKNKHFKLARAIEEIAESYGNLHERHPSEYPYPPWPNLGGILRWGTTGNGDDIFWLTSEMPDKWSVVVHHHTSARMITFRGLGMVDFLVNLLEGTLKDNPFHPDMLKPPEYVSVSTEKEK